MSRLGIPNDVINLPFLRGLRQTDAAGTIQIVEQSLEENCTALLDRKLDAGFVSVVDYAKYAGQLSIVENTVVYSRGASRQALLFFQENLQDIREIACYSKDSHYQILANNVMREFYEMEVDWVELSARQSLEDILSKYQACFLEGDEAIANFRKWDGHLDLVEEWHDKTGKAYIHQLLVVHEASLDATFVEPLMTALDAGLDNLVEITQSQSGSNPQNPQLHLETLADYFKFVPDDVLWDEFKAYLEILFYYATIDYMPDIRFF